MEIGMWLEIFSAANNKMDLQGKRDEERKDM